LTWYELEGVYKFIEIIFAYKSCIDLCTRKRYVVREDRIWDMANIENLILQYN